MSGWRGWVACGLCALLAGCGGAGGGEAGVRKPGRPQDRWQTIAEATPMEKAANTSSFEPGEAPACPTVEVVSADGAEVELEPGRAGFAERGTVSLVVFWSVQTVPGQTALVHVRDLVSKYRQWRVRGVAIAPGGPADSANADFARQLGLPFPCYFDTDLSALKRLSKAADAEVRTAVPSVFIVDRKQRIRFYRGGFRYALAVGDEGGNVVLETAAPGDAIEDYLKVILAEE